MFSLVHGFQNKDKQFIRSKSEEKHKIHFEWLGFDLDFLQYRSQEVIPENVVIILNSSENRND